MDRFQVIQPSPLLAPYIKQYWFLTMDNAPQSKQRLVPLGCMALTFHRGSRTYSSVTQGYFPQSYLSGIATEYTDLIFSGHVQFISIVFQPAGAYAFFNMSLNEFSNSHISLDDLGDSECLELERKLGEITDDEECIPCIEKMLLNRLQRFNRYTDLRIESVIKAIYTGETNVKSLAESTCVGYKQFKRFFTGHIGTTPKNYLQIVRFQKLHTCFQQNTGLTLEEIAYECGYYDKSHLIKELKEFSGFTSMELRKACDPVYSPYHAFFRSAFIDLPFP